MKKGKAAIARQGAAQGPPLAPAVLSRSVAHRRRPFRRRRGGRANTQKPHRSELVEIRSRATLPACSRGRTKSAAVLDWPGKAQGVPEAPKNGLPRGETWAMPTPSPEAAAQRKRAGDRRGRGRALKVPAPHRVHLLHRRDRERCRPTRSPRCCGAARRAGLRARPHVARRAPSMTTDTLPEGKPWPRWRSTAGRSRESRGFAKWVGK